jgi:histidyl-tRNA synthetase
MQYKQPKGTFDILPQELHDEDAWKTSDRWQHIESVMRRCARDYGFREIRTPIFEMTGVFTSGVGETSDIVSKEMYTFKDKADRSMSLRPEGTASVVRAFIENHLPQMGQQHKLFYIGPYFRYDRPQAGRYRQFHQFGVEAIGDPSPEQDVEIIDLYCEILRRLNLKDLTLLLNTVGDKETRDNYKEALVAYLRPTVNSLSNDSQVRLEKNPLRILDSKDPADKMALKDAPSIHDYLSDPCKEHFAKVKQMMDTLDISYTVDPNLVRGLDYYNQTVFEVTSNVLGAQNSIGAGGRYDGLIKRFGGPDLPSTGFAMGIERILSTMAGQNAPFPKPPSPFLHLVPLDASSKEAALEIAYKLRHREIPTEVYTRGKKLQKAMQEVSQTGSTHCIVLGENEITSGTVEIKHMETRQTEKISFSNIATHIETLWKTRT